MSRVVCRSFGAGVWNGIEFREVEVDGLMVGVAEVEGEALDWFRARPHAFTVIDPEGEPGSALEPELDDPEAEDEPEAPADEEPKGKKRK
ncbi:MAG: hypothetical protein M0R28_21390 [Pigmentiphaga sp.]|nr:hypothetical protein [Pigmentiphaga sp.]